MNKERISYRYTVFQNLWYILKGAKKWQPSVMPFVVLQSISAGISGFIWLYGARYLISCIEHPEQVKNGLSSLAVIVLAAVVSEVLCGIGLLTGLKQIEARMTDVRGHFILMINQKMLQIPNEMIEDPKVLNAQRKVNWATNNPEEGVEGIVKHSALFFGRLIVMLTASVILIGLHPLLIPVMLLIAVLQGISFDNVSRFEKEKVIDPTVTKEREVHYYYRTVTNFDFAKDIRIYNMQKPLYRKMEAIHEELHGFSILLHGKWQKALLKIAGMDFLQEGLMYLLLVYAVIQNKIGIADFTLYVGIIRSFNLAVRELFRNMTDMKKDSRFLCDYRIFMEYPEIGQELPVKSNFTKDYEGIMMSEKENKIPVTIPEDKRFEFIFDNVSFRYPGSDTYVLKNLSLTLKAGERLAVVGLNGAGKTTFIKLLCRLYEPTEGKIYMNGTDISVYDREDYYKLISPVFQTIECFAFPITENVSMRLTEKTDRDKVKQCLIDAGLGEKIESLENGMDTQMLKFLYLNGIDLSGGEKQKLGLARALYKDAPVVVLDEPTAALDALAEYKIYKDFDKLIGNKTAVYISHRLSSTRFCSRVAMFGDGEIVEYGTHEELISAKGAYAEMFDMQAVYYKEGVAANG